MRSVYGRGRAAIFARCDLAVECKNCPLIDSLSEELNFECCSIVYGDNVCVVCIYHSNNVIADYNIFINKFEQLLRFCSDRFKHVIITGDLNVDKLNQNKNRGEYSRYVVLKDLIESYCLKCLFVLCPCALTLTCDGNTISNASEVACKFGSFF